ncbi:MAG: tetratricopeptide repeat protein, partial [Myxococcota bacterium]
MIRLNNISAGLVQWVAALEMDQGKMQPYIAEMRELLPKGIGSALETDQPWAAVRMIGALRQLDPQHPDASDLKLREAREAYAQKLVRVVRYQQAADLYGELADRWPDRPEYRLEQGALQLALEQREAAIQTLEAWVAAATTDAERAKHLSAAGERAFDRNVLDLAEQYWTRALETDPKLRSAHVNLARVHLQQRQAEQGYEHLRAYIDAAPTDPRGFEDAAQVALDYNNGAIALEVLEEASLKATPDFTVTTLLADLYQRRQRRADMEEALQRFIDRADNDREATLEVTEWLEKKREVELAAYHLEKAIAAGGKEDPQLWYRLARLHAAADKPEEMEQALREYVERSDQQLDATMAAARLLMQKRYYDRAEALLNDGRKRNPKDSKLLNLLAEVYHQWGYADREEKVWRDWIALQPNVPAATLKIGQLYARRADVERAVALLTIAARDKTVAPEAYLTMGEAYQRRGMDKEMRQAFDRYLDVSPDRPQALRTLLARYSEPARAEDAIRVLDMLLKATPDDIDLHFELGERYLQLGDSERTLASFSTFIRENRSPIRAARRAARPLRNRKRYGLVLELYEVLLEVKGDDPEVLAEVGDLYMKLSRDYRMSTPTKADQMEDAARGFYQRYIDSFNQNSKDKRALSQFASELAKQDLWTQAASAFERVQQLGLSMRPIDHFYYGKTLLNLGRFEEADRAMQAHLGSLKDTKARFYHVGRAAYNAGAWELSLRYLRRVLDQQVEDHVEPAFDMISRMLVRSGRRDELEPVSYQYLKLNRATWPSRAKVANLYAEAGLWRQAADEYRDMLR